MAIRRSLPILLTIAFLSAHADRIVAQVSLPWKEDFSPPQLSAGWAIDVAPGNRVEVKDGALAITAAANTFAHIEQPLGKDYIAATARLKSAPAVTWTSSLFLYWNPRNWCQMGVIDRNGGCFYVTQMVAGAYEEHDLDPCAWQEWQWVRIELGEDCVRYLSSKDSKRWEALLVTRRSAEFSGAPTLLIVGKGYSRGEAPYAASDLDNSYPDPGGVGVSWVDDVRVEATAGDRRKASSEERLRFGLSDANSASSRDVCGEEELARPGDPSYETVSRYFPGMKHPREVIGVPAHPNDIGVREDGALEFTDNAGAADAHMARFLVGDPPVPFAADQARVKRRLVDGWMPAVVITFPHEGLEYEQTALGYSEGYRTDTDLSAYLRFTVRNAGKAARRTDVRIVWQSGGEPVVHPLEVLPGSSATVCWRMAYSPGNRPPQEEITPRDFNARLTETRSFWRQWIGQGMTLTVPEPGVAEAWKAWLCFSSLDVDQHGDRFEAHDGAGFYEAIFGYSAALYAHALDLWGRRVDAERVLQTLLSYQGKDGLYTQNYGLPDQGALLIALAEHYRLTRDLTWLRRVAPNIRAAGEWIVRQRAASRRERPDRSQATYGLIRFRPYCDYGEPVFNYYAEAYTCRGLEEAAATLSLLGDPAAKRFRHEAADYRHDLLTSMDRAVIERQGMKILPMEPDTHRLLKGSGYLGGGYYGLVASMLLEPGFLPPADKRSSWITNFMEQRRGLIAGLCEFAGGVDHAYTYGYLLTHLERDNVERVLLGFYSMLAYGMSRDTYSGVECTQLKTGQNAMTLPHLYSATQQLRLLRMMVVREEGDGLLVGYALPRSWLAQGQRVAARQMPTRFGPLSFEFRSNVDHGEIIARLVPPKSRPHISLRLRTPTRKEIASVTVDGRPWKRFTQESIDLGNPSRLVNVEARYKAVDRKHEVARNRPSDCPALRFQNALRRRCRRQVSPER